MRTSITLAFDSKGVATMVAGPDVALKEQVEGLAACKAGRIPKGFVRVERWSSDAGRVQVAFKRPKAEKAEKPEVTETSNPV